MIEHIVELRGPKVFNGRRDPEAIGSVLKWVPRLVAGTASMAFRYSSALPGRRPQWLSDAIQLDFVRIERAEDCTRLVFKAPRFGDAAAVVYQQQEFKVLDIRPDPSLTGFDLLRDVIGDIRRQNRDSLAFDTRLLKRLGGLGTTGRRWGVDSLTFRGDQLPEDQPVCLDKQASELAKTLVTETPRPRRARVAGRLDMIRASDGAFGLVLETGETIYGALKDGESQTLKDLWDQEIVVEGMAVFRASGSLLRMEAEGIAPARKADAFFSVMPEPIDTPLNVRELLKPQDSRSGLAAVFGKWPGDETEEELLEALRRVS